MAAAMLWALILLRRRALGSLRGLALGAMLGLCGYAVQAALYFGALERIEAGLASLLLYAYPALVTVGAFLLRRESPNRRKLGALALASGGVALVLAGGGTGAIDWLGASMALGSAAFYTVFILAADRVAATTSPLAFAASVATGAGLAFAVAALVQGGFDASEAGVMWTALIASVSTVMPIVAVHGRPRAHRAVDGVDRLDDRAAVHRRARLDRVRRDARPAPARRRRARALRGRAPPAPRPWHDGAMACVVSARRLAREGREERVAELTAARVARARVLHDARLSSARSASGERPVTRSSRRQSSSSPPSASHAHVSSIVARSGRGASPAAAARPPAIP